MLVTLDNGLQLEQHTAATWYAFRAAVKAETGVTLHITKPNGAHRTTAMQQLLRDKWERGDGDYAAPPGESNHEDGTAFDIANYKTVPTATLQAIGRRFGLKRDPSEAWHYNDLGTYTIPAGAPGTQIGDDVSFADIIKHGTVDAPAVVVLADTLTHAEKSRKMLDDIVHVKHNGVDAPLDVVLADTLIGVQQANANVTALTAAVRALSESSGLSPAEVLAVVEERVDGALSELRISRP